VLTPLLASTRVELDGAGARAEAPAMLPLLDAQLWDRGARFGVSLGREPRSWSDPAHRCDERARAAAVFLALAVEPPLPPDPGEPTAPRGSEASLAPSMVDRPEAASRAALPAAGREGGSAGPRALVELELAARYEAAPRTTAEQSLHSGGGELGLYVGSRSLGASLRVAGLSPVTMVLPGASVDLLRLPHTAALRGTLRFGRLRLSAEVGATATLLRSAARQLDGGVPSTTLLGGLFVGLSTRVDLPSGGTPLLSVGLLVDPVPRPLALRQAGTIGMTPSIWLGVSIGYVFRVRG
jgi:hypothetical protein